jgi:hypothetical protein
MSGDYPVKKTNEHTPEENWRIPSGGEGWKQYARVATA